MKNLTLILAYLFPLFLFSQSDSLIFSGAIKINFKEYKRQSAAVTGKVIQNAGSSCSIRL